MCFLRAFTCIIVYFRIADIDQATVLKICNISAGKQVVAMMLSAQLSVLRYEDGLLDISMLEINRS
jgi:hypothetical protein